MLVWFYAINAKGGRFKFKIPRNLQYTINKWCVLYVFMCVGCEFSAKCTILLLKAPDTSINAKGENDFSSNASANLTICKHVVCILSVLMFTFGVGGFDSFSPIKNGGVHSMCLRWWVEEFCGLG